MEEHENHKEEVIEIKVPKFLKIGHLRKNPWIISTIVFGILSAVLIFNSFYGTSFSGGAISANQAGEKIAKFLSDNAGVQVNIGDVSVESGMYKVNLDYQGGLIPIYVTRDGKYFIQSPVSLDEKPSGSGSSDGASADVGAFLNNPSLYPSLGPSDAKNVVIEFSDFQCPFCAIASGLPSWVGTATSQYGDLLGAAGKVEKMAQEGKLKFVYVSMSFLGQESVYAAEAGLCANEQGKFWEMHDAIFTAQTQGENNGKYNKDNLEIIANGVSGLDQSKFKACLEGDKYLSAVQKINGEASKAAQGTPTFYVNGKQVSASWTAIEKEIGN